MNQSQKRKKKVQFSSQQQKYNVKTFLHLTEAINKSCFHEEIQENLWKSSISYSVIVRHFSKSFDTIAAEMTEINYGPIVHETINVNHAKH